MKYLLKSTSTRALLKGAVLHNCQTLKRGSFFDGEVNLYSSQLLDRNIAKKIRQARFAVCSAQAQHIHSGLMRQAPAVSATVGLPGSVLMHNNIPIQKKASFAYR